MTAGPRSPIQSHCFYFYNRLCRMRSIVRAGAGTVSELDNVVHVIHFCLVKERLRLLGNFHRARSHCRSRSGRAFACTRSCARGGANNCLGKKDRLDPHSRATVIFPRTLEAFAQWNVLEPFLNAGNKVPHVRLRYGPNGKQFAHFDFTQLIDSTEFPFALALPQNETERILLEAVAATGMSDVRFGREVVSCSQGPEKVQIGLRQNGGEETLEGKFLVGADGAHSVVRASLGFELVGKTYPTRAFLADIRVPEKSDQSDFWPALIDERGLIVGIRFGNRIFRIVEDAISDEVSEPNLDAHIGRITKRLFGDVEPEIIWKSIYHKHRRVAPDFRRENIILVGDAAHLNSPAGGQGMNSGIQDSHNLAWKLASAMNDQDAQTDTLIQSYAEERRTYIESVIETFTDMAERFQSAPIFIRVFLTRVLGRIFGINKSAPSMARRLAMLEFSYKASPLLRGNAQAVGRRVPNAILGDGKRLYSKLSGGAALLCCGANDSVKAIARETKVSIVDVDVFQLAKFFGQNKFAAVVRPDQIVGCVAAPDALDRATVMAALGRMN